MANKLEIVSCIYCHDCLVREDTLINNNTDRILDVVFSRFRVFFVHNNPEADYQRSYVHAMLNYNTQEEPVLRRMRVPVPEMSSS